MQEIADVVVLVAGGEQGAQDNAAAGGDGFLVVQGYDDVIRRILVRGILVRGTAQAVLQARRQFRMAAHGAVKGFLEPVQAADVVAVAVGNEDGVDGRAAQGAPVVHNLPPPAPVGFAGVDDRHPVVGVAHEVDLRAAGVHGAVAVGILGDVDAVHIFGNLHWAASPGLTMPCCGCSGKRRWPPWRRRRPMPPAGRPTAAGCPRRRTGQAGACP